MGKRKSWLQKGMFKKGQPYTPPVSCSRPPKDGPSGDGQILESVTVPRLSAQDYKLVVKRTANGVMSLPDADGHCTGARVLRPKKSVDDSTTSRYLQGEGKGEMRLLDRDLILDMVNTCYREHAEREDGCRVPQFELLKETKKGLCWSQSLKCKGCSYESKMFKLYEEVASQTRGPKPAKPNVGLHVGLQECSIGNTKARVLLASTNTPPPNPSTLQRSSNKVARITSSAAEQDLQSRCANMKNINRLRGLPADSAVPVTFDVRYNSNTIASRSKMGQSATQAIGVAIEGQTDQKQIFGLHLENKLCHQGALLRGRGINVTCPGGHRGCTANKSSPEPFTEYDIAKQIGTSLAAQNIKVKYFTTDGDSKSADGMQAAMSELDPTWRVCRQADTTHLGQSLFRSVLKTQFSDAMFNKGCDLEKKDQQKLFALDLKHRTQKIYREMYTQYAGNITKISKRVPTVIECSIDCYAGDCQSCRKQSVVCPGGKNNWRSQSKYLQVCGATHFNLTEADRQEIRDLMKFYLGGAALNLLKMNTNTNKNEAANRAISASLPKNVKYCRNAKARALSAICRLNKGAGNSLLDSLEVVGSAIARGGYTAKAVKQIQNRADYHKQYKKTPKYKCARNKRRFRQMNEYYKMKREKKISDYAKGQQDPPLQTRNRKLKPNIHIEHPYTRQHRRHDKHDHTYPKN